MKKASVFTVSRNRMLADTAKYLSSKRIDLAIMSSSGKRENNPNYEYKKNQSI